MFLVRHRLRHGTKCGLWLFKENNFLIYPYKCIIVKAVMVVAIKFTSVK